MPAFDLSGALRRIRRLTDLSQRELGRACGVSQSAVAQAETGRRDLPVGALVIAADLAGLRLTLTSGDGAEVPGMATDRARDLGARRFPAHLDTQHSDEAHRLYEPRRDRPETWFTFRRDREARNSRRREHGTPEDHHEYDAGSSPSARAAARRIAGHRAAAEAARQRLSAGDIKPLEVGWSCSCPPGCDELEDWSARPVHAENCPCSCDVG